MLRYPRGQKIRARQARSNQTDAEGKLWARLRARQLCGAKFRRQHAIGPFITDFCCVERGLVIELDGGHHTERVKADRVRTTFIEQHGYRVLRFWDNEVLQNMESVLEQRSVANMESVLEQIAIALKDSHPFPLPNRARVKKIKME